MSKAPEYRDHLRALVREQARPPHKFGHQPRLYRLCQQLAPGLNADDDVLFAAAWLHDLGVFEGNRPAGGSALERWDHVAYAVIQGQQILEETDFPHEKISRVLDAVRQHQPDDEPLTIEATIVRDADILEQLGAVGILRTSAKLGSDTRFQSFLDARNYLTRQLQALPSKLRLPRAQQMAVSRIAALQSFLSSLETETEMALD